MAAPLYHSVLSLRNHSVRAAPHLSTVVNITCRHFEVRDGWLSFVFPALCPHLGLSKPIFQLLTPSWEKGEGRRLPGLICASGFPYLTKKTERVWVCAGPAAAVMFQGWSLESRLVFSPLMHLRSIRRVPVVFRCCIFKDDVLQCVSVCTRACVCTCVCSLWA